MEHLLPYGSLHSGNALTDCVGNALGRTLEGNRDDSPSMRATQIAPGSLASRSISNIQAGLKRSQQLEMNQQAVVNALHSLGVGIEKQSARNGGTAHSCFFRSFALSTRDSMPRSSTTSLCRGVPSTWPDKNPSLNCDARLWANMSAIECNWWRQIAPYAA